MTTIDYSVVATRLTTDRLTSDLDVMQRDVAKAIELYDWNTEIGGAL